MFSRMQYISGPIFKALGMSADLNFASRCTSIVPNGTDFASTRFWFVLHCAGIINSLSVCVLNI